jgi:hypothetical protein
VKFSQKLILEMIIFLFHMFSYNKSKKGEGGAFDWRSRRERWIERGRFNYY